MSFKRKQNPLALIIFLASTAFLIFIFGFAVGKYKIPPYPIISYASQGFGELKKQLLRFTSLGSQPDKDLPKWIVKSERPKSPLKPDKAYPGLNLITGTTRDFTLKAEIIDMSGKVLHTWAIDWYSIWPDAKHLPETVRPKNRPGTEIHGAVLMENGDLVFNFEHHGLIRLDLKGKVVWRLPYQTHHSVYRQDDGNLWVCGQIYHAEPDARFPFHNPPFYEDTILEVTPKGKIISEWSVPDILIKNNLTGLLYLNMQKDDTTPVLDVLHLNDVEPFPLTMQEGFFTKDDIMISLRNINTVLVFNRTNLKIKFISTGAFIRQHDPDFINGHTISVLDNNYFSGTGHKPQSRIVIMTAPDKKTVTFFAGTDKQPFYTYVKGKHQWLPNGNLLITEACSGRAFEITKDGEIVWEYINSFENGYAGHITEAQRIPLHFKRLFDNR